MDLAMKCCGRVSEPDRVARLGRLRVVRNLSNRETSLNAGRYRGGETSLGFESRGS